MVIIGMYFILFFMVVLYFLYKKDMRNTKWLQYVALWSIPLTYIAGQLGWIVAEMEGNLDHSGYSSGAMSASAVSTGM